MNWAKLWAKGKENSARNRQIVRHGNSFIFFFMIGAIYAGLNPRLTRAAGLSVLAHLEDLVARGLVATAGSPSIDGRYRLAG